MEYVVRIAFFVAVSRKYGVTSRSSMTRVESPMYTETAAWTRPSVAVSRPSVMTAGMILSR